MLELPLPAAPEQRGLCGRPALPPNLKVLLLVELPALFVQTVPLALVELPALLVQMVLAQPSLAGVLQRPNPMHRCPMHQCSSPMRWTHRGWKMSTSNLLPGGW